MLLAILIRNLLTEFTVLNCGIIMEVENHKGGNLWCELGPRICAALSPLGD